MLELGESSEKEHKLIVELTNELGLESIFIGNEFSSVEETSFKNTNEYSKFLKKDPIKNKSILLKGSRGIALEKLVDLL